MRSLPLKFLLPAAGAAVLIAGALLIVRNPGRPPRPDIVLVSIDTLRADRLGCYGCPAPTSPNIDAFARESVRFARTVSQAPSTASSHMSLFTGLLPPVHRVTNLMVERRTWRELELGLPPAVPTLAEYLRESGYRTAGFHGGGNVSAILGFDRGFDHYQKTPWEDLYRDPSPLQRVSRWLDGKEGRNKPFFLFIHHYICHDPYLQAPPRFRRRFLPAPVKGLEETLERIAPEGMKPTRNFNPIRKEWWGAIDGGSEAHRRHIRGLYDAGVSYADFVTGRILDYLKGKGLYERSLIIVTSDHGEQFWEHGGTCHRGWLFNETLHVPLLVRFPGGEHGGRVIGTPVALFDLMPTILDLLKISPRLEMTARSLLPLTRGKPCAARPLVSVHEELATLRVEDRGIAYCNQPSNGRREWLFDRAGDPGEQNDLVAARPRDAGRMRALAAGIMREQRLLHSWTRAGAPGPRPLPEDLRKQLEALGYL